MDDYISRQTVINAAEQIIARDTSGDNAVVNAMTAWKEYIKGLPFEDVQPVRHGHWIIKDNPGTGWYRVTCSECGEDVTSTVPVIGFFPNAKAIWNYCPNCGAKMDGEQNE